MNSDVACEARFKWCKARHFKEQSYEEYRDRVLADKPEFLKNDDYIDNLYQQIADDKAAGIDRPTIDFYHITDLHIQTDYVVGTKNQDCGNIVCCKRGKP